MHSKTATILALSGACQLQRTETSKAAYSLNKHLIKDSGLQYRLCGLLLELRLERDKAGKA